MKKIFILAALAFTGSQLKAQTPGNALYFDGSGDYVVSALPTVFSNIAANNFTVETWVQPMATGGTSRIFFAQMSASVFASILLNGSNTPYFYVSTGSSSFGNTISASLTAGQWTHLAVTWNASTSTMEIYLNGVLQTLSSGGSSSTGSDGLMALGGKTDGTQNFNGELDEFRIWSTVRTACEINSTINSEMVGNEAGLLHYYNFNEGTAGGTNTGVTTLPDITGANDGTLNGFALTGSTSNWIASGVAITATGAVIPTSTSAMTICQGDTIVFGGNNVFATGTYNDTLIGSTGCDSVHTLNLTVNSVNTGVSQAGATLTANAAGATYQWLDCNAGFSPLSGATSAEFDPSTNGSYAVQVMESGCTDTSTCYLVTTTGIDGLENVSGAMVFPNPVNHVLNVSNGKSGSEGEIIISDASGRQWMKTSHVTLPVQLNLDALPAGIYLLNLSENSGNKVFRIVKL